MRDKEFNDKSDKCKYQKHSINSEYGVMICQHQENRIATCVRQECPKLQEVLESEG